MDIELLKEKHDKSLRIIKLIEETQETIDGELDWIKSHGEVFSGLAKEAREAIKVYESRIKRLTQTYYKINE